MHSTAKFVQFTRPVCVQCVCSLSLCTAPHRNADVRILFAIVVSFSVILAKEQHYSRNSVAALRVCVSECVHKT